MQFTQDKIVVRKHGRTPGQPLDTKKAELAKLLNDVKGLVLLASNARRADLKATWFGGNLPATRSMEIDVRLRKVYQFLNGLEQFTFTSANNDPNSIASFPQQDNHKVPGGMALGALLAKYRRSAFLYIGPKYSAVSYEDKVLTLVHEFTHMTLGTADAKVGGKEMYGAGNCKKLAVDSPDLAYSNAENWALYCMSYWGLWRH